MTADSTQDITLRRERVNKHSVRFTARDCTESATAPCPSVTLPTALVEQLIGEADELLVRVYSGERAAAPVEARRASEALRERLGVADLAEVSPIYEELLDQLPSDSAVRLAVEQVRPSPLGRSLTAEVTRQAQLVAPTEHFINRVPVDTLGWDDIEVHDCSCGVTGSKAEPTCAGHPHTGSGD